MATTYLHNWMEIERRSPAVGLAVAEKTVAGEVRGTYLDTHVADGVAEVLRERIGGLSNVAKRRIDELIAEMDLPFGLNAASAKVRPGAPTPGTTVTRLWHGQEIVVHVLERGFDWNGATYRSLTAVARAVTGAHWNGRIFFGLSKRKGA